MAFYRSCRRTIYGRRLTCRISEMLAHSIYFVYSFLFSLTQLSSNVRIFLPIVHCLSGLLELLVVLYCIWTSFKRYAVLHSHAEISVFAERGCGE